MENGSPETRSVKVGKGPKENQKSSTWIVASRNQLLEPVCGRLAAAANRFERELDKGS